LFKQNWKAERFHSLGLRLVALLLFLPPSSPLGMMAIPTLVCLLAVAKAVAGFTFSHSDPVECQDMTLQW
jgi:hypothetical protein